MSQQGLAPLRPPARARRCASRLVRSRL